MAPASHGVKPRWPPARGRRRLLLLASLIAASVAWGCAPKQVGRDAGTAVTEAWNQSRDTVTSAARQVVGAAMGELRQTARDSLQPALDSTLKRLEDSLAAFVAKNLSDSLSRLLNRNVAVLSASMNAAVGAWVERLSASVRTDLGPELGRAAETAATRAASALATSLGGDSLRRAVVTLADSVVTQAIAAIGRESRRQTSRLPWWAWAAVIGFGLAVLALVGLFVVNVKRIHQREASLRLVTLAVQERGDLAVKSRVKELATQHGVEPWLNAFLREQRLLMPPR